MPQSPPQPSIGRQSLSLVLRTVHEAGPLTRTELASRTQLKRSTIRDLVAELDRQGLVREGESERRVGRGRPSVVVRARPEGAIVLAAEIGVQSLTVATVGLGGHVHGRASFAHRPDRFGPAETVADIVELSRPLLRSIDAERLVGVAVGVPGMVRAEDGFVHVAPNLGWRDVPLGTQLADACRSELGVTSSVLVRNESDLGALAEHLRTRSDVRDLVYVLGEVGIGTGVIANGRLLTGKAGYAGALGHLPVNPQGLVCGCGATGCWETEAGTGALLRHAGYAPDDSREAVEDVLARAALGDEVAVAAVDAVAYWLGVGLAAIVNVFNPERIVLDGIFAEIHPLAADRIETELASRALGPPRDVVEVVPSSLGADATLLGAAEVAFAPLLRNSAELTPVRRRPRPAARGTAAA